ncbi:MAG TPA: ABC transporter ATP-binding protein [Methanocella sp.]|nr:ABC transporter ATP-binding protein [Methanocella sp.]
MGLFFKGREKSDDPDAIVVKGVSKCFRIPREKKRTVYQNILGLIKGNFGYEEFWALQDVDFTVRRGETFGVIGPNGSGKSTLLKILAWVLYPEKGSVAINGRLAPFLELGVGFHPELTARDNVYLYGSILGLRRRELNGKYGEIMDFAELKRFENVKLRNFSSGMYVRLAFSTAIQANPDILLLDEILAVGDEHFQKKCMDKIEEFRKNGKTIVFVSHDLDAVKKLCRKTMLLQGGRIASMGETEHVMGEYLRMVGDTKNNRGVKEPERMKKLAYM